jgi:hypothetical protein
MIDQQIPFVQRLGDSLDEVIAAPVTARRRRRTWARRFGVVSVVVALAGGGAVATAKLVRTPEELATGQLVCELGPSEYAVDWAGAGDPVPLCAAAFRAYGKPVPKLVACAAPGGISVIPGRDPDLDCATRGYQPVPAGYAAAQQKTAALQRDIIALEDTADCIPVPEFQRRLADLLRRTGWSRWKPLLRLDLGNGRCGAVADRYEGHVSVGAALLPDSHEVIVLGLPPVSVRERVNGVHGLARTTPPISLERCWSKPALRQRVDRTLRPTGLPYRIVDEPPLRPNGELTGKLSARWRAGCAILHEAHLEPDGSVTVAILQERPPR